MHKTTPGQYDVETFSGTFLDVRNPRVEDIDLEDIAHALAQTCRYGGHCQEFYSVAEHAVFVSIRLERKGYPLPYLFAGLHHDDAEAYLGDIPRPIKPLLGQVYTDLTDQLDEFITAALGLDAVGIGYGSPEHVYYHDDAIKEADNWALLVEARHLLPSQGRTWDSHATGKTWTAGQPDRIVTPDYWHGGLVPNTAKLLYLRRHRDLMERIV